MHLGTRWPALVWNVQYSGLLGYAANDGNHKLLTYLIELFWPINLLSDTVDTRDRSEILETKMKNSNFFPPYKIFIVINL